MILDRSNFHNYQETATSHILEHTHGALFLDMGLGKTVCTLTAIDELMYGELEINKTLVIGPVRVIKSVWEAEIEKWNHLKRLKAVQVVGTPKQRAEILKQDADIYLLSVNNTVWFCEQYKNKDFPFDMMVIDELSSFKNQNSKRFKALRKIQPLFKRIVGLTGTPAPNGLIDLWSQIYLLDSGERLGKFITHFRDEYFRPGARNGAIVYNYILRKGSEERIHNRVSDVCMSMKNEDYLDMPERIDNIIEVELTPKLQKQYNEFEKEQVMEIMEASEGVISAVNAAALSNKLLQFANGAIYDEDKNWHEIHDLKIKTVEELIENANGQPILIAWTFRHDMYRLKKALKKYNPRELEDDKTIRDWNAGKIQVLMMHPASGGHGLNLQAGGNIIIWFGQTWSLELEQQLNARLHRQGQQNAVVINKLVTTKTHESDVIKSQISKDKTQSALMDAVKARIEIYEKHFDS